ncbi:long-chain fatty acid--CoA ligase [Aggregicoccus sp. 17bor-14]|uniref:acyl-CoA synthetase n=1 Tax=Myxococcaceae TaxID=31 RepID=UPI00129CD9F8|nr:MULTISPECIES: long-chain fatty acid--CoA ligase [Myxococcaceae]MBF5043582.1 long-chain fatty acid--CoA ligase [Simulacricoccus sp. 17bor-14]MRI89341.1 long-chain fatty acid--CoA ligase [Aggregicoccus sp. 17bor-14]
MPIESDWLLRRAEADPEALALVDAARGGQRLSYGAWNARVNRTAHFLRDSLGITHGERVAALAHNCTELLDLLFACAKLGAIFQPLNWRLSAPELALLVSDAAPRALVYGPELRPTAQALRRMVPGVLPHYVALDLLEDLPFAAREAHPDAELPALALDCGDPWVLCGTGGSTGSPKQAVLTHGSMQANAQNTVASWGLDASDVALLNAPLFHTGGLNVFTTPLVYAGGASVVCRGFDVEQVFDQVQRGAVSLLFGVPTMFLEMQRHPRFEQVDFARLKLVISGGAPCPPPVFERFFARGVDFRTGYGLTEAGPNNFWLPPEQVRRKPGAVGVPVSGVEARLDGEGAQGELLLRGAHVCAGYWNCPEETARAFDDGWLRTGDLAERDADGHFRIVGRLKEVILSGGENVYPSEVESVLSGHAAVAEVAVIGAPDSTWGEVPHALVVARPGCAPLTLELLHRVCEGRLARYKWPRSLQLLPALPRTAAGKVDRRALMAARSAS